VLGLSYGAVSDVLDALQTLLGKALFLSKTTVYRNVQASGQKTRHLRRAWLQQDRRICVIGADLTLRPHRCLLTPNAWLLIWRQCRNSSKAILTMVRNSWLLSISVIVLLQAARGRESDHVVSDAPVGLASVE
jgi:hypothetical protein